VRKEGVFRPLAAALAAAGALLLVTGPAAAEDVAPPPATAPLGDGGWSYFSDPRAVQVSLPRKLLYAGWVTSLGSIVAGIFDPATQHVSTMVLQDRLQNDDHANPSVLALPDGRVSYFWSDHDEAG